MIHSFRIFCSSWTMAYVSKRKQVMYLRKGKRRKIVLVSLSIIIAGTIVFFCIQCYVDCQAAPYITELSQAPEADAVLVLGARVYQNGSPSPALQDRLDYGYDLYAQGTVKKILVSGDHGTKEYDEVNAMKDYLLSKGVPREDIFLDHAGFNTYDSIYRTRDIFQVHTLIIATQEFHIKRAVYIARCLGLAAYGVAAPDKSIYAMRYNRFRESLAKVKAFFDTEVIKRQPAYLGDVIPIMGNGIATDG